MNKHSPAACLGDCGQHFPCAVGDESRGASTVLDRLGEIRPASLDGPAVPGWKHRVRKWLAVGCRK